MWWVFYLPIIYAFAINLFAFALMGIDKRRAKRSAWRIPEGTLLLVAVLGGAFGALMGMYVFRHKTRHRRFKWGLPIILCVQVILAVVGADYLSFL